jgi:hypothetical protein
MRSRPCPRSPKLLLLPAKGRQRARARRTGSDGSKFDRIWDMRGKAKQSNGNGRVCVVLSLRLEELMHRHPHGHLGKAVARVAAGRARTLIN